MDDEFITYAWKEFKEYDSNYKRLIFLRNLVNSVLSSDEVPTDIKRKHYYCFMAAYYFMRDRNISPAEQISESYEISKLERRFVTIMEHDTKKDMVAHDLKLKR